MDRLRRQAQFERLFNPLKPGFAYVRTEEFVKEFEERHDTTELTPEMLQRARMEAVACVQIVEDEICLQIEGDADRFMQEGTEPGWNASNVEEMQMNLTGFCNSNVGVWERAHFPEYKERNPRQLDEHGLEYVDSFIGWAITELPSHIMDGDDSIYFDSEETVQDEGDESDSDDADSNDE